MSLCEKYPFEARIPVDCVMDAVAVVRSGELMTRKGELLTHIGAVAGELGAFIHKYEHPDVFAQVSNLPETLEECVAEWEKLAEEDKQVLASMKAGEEVANSVYWIALAIKLIRLLIDELT